MASARDGTPMSAQPKIGQDGAVISEFDPLGSTAKKFEDGMATPKTPLGLMASGSTLKQNFMQIDVKEPQITIKNIASPKFSGA